MSPKIISVALDAMSGDHGPQVTVPAALTIAKEYPNLHLILVGQTPVLESILKIHPDYAACVERITIQHASEIVAMDDPPAQAMRNKKDSSMRVMINLVKEGKAHACVSAGNTGALMATARFVLKMIPGIDRPAICSPLPAMQGRTYILDLGANVDCTAEHLQQFAIMGSVLASAVTGIVRPRVGLLNIGEEDIKGNEVVKETSVLLNKSSLNYIGYVEANDIFTRKADVVVADGFVGNVLLKTAEGTAKLMAHFMEAEFKRNLFSKVGALCALPALRGLKKRMDPRMYNGASLLGLQGIVVKSHGGADQVAFAAAIRVAVLEVEHNVLSHIAAGISSASAEPVN
ncbi:MAG: phosphate acyltransferase PlsX [Gammaproteobacteria bacterium]|nr:phosphate acyltransferase PlsX [Gammaproteobacteria bacterium]